MLKWFKSLFKAPEPSGPPQTIRAFHTSDAPISKDRVLVDQEGWLIDSREDQSVSLFEVPEAGVEQCVLTFKAKIKTNDLKGRAFLEMWCRVPC